MKLKQVTLITILCLGVSFIMSAAMYPWEHVSRNPKMIAHFLSMALWQSALLFFFINLYRKG
jgi:hypothetical protein